MNVARIALTAIAVALVAAEVARPTTFGVKHGAAFDRLELDDLPPVVTPAIGNIDRVSVTNASGSRTLLPSQVVTGNDTLQLVGWCADPTSREPGSALIAIVDDRRRIDVSTGYRIARPDVATYYSAPDLRASGFAVALPAATFGPGSHVVEIGVITADRTAVAELPIDVTFRVR